jgi:hypothetical protein
MASFEKRRDDVVEEHPDAVEETGLVHTALMQNTKTNTDSPKLNGNGGTWKQLTAKAEAERCGSSELWQHWARWHHTDNVAGFNDAKSKKEATRQWDNSIRHLQFIVRCVPTKNQCKNHKQSVLLGRYPHIDTSFHRGKSSTTTSTARHCLR